MMVHQHPKTLSKPVRYGRRAAIKYLMKLHDIKEDEAMMRYNSFNKYQKSDLCQKALKK